MQICGENRLQISVMNFLVMVTVHSVPSNTLRDAGNMNLLVQSPRSIVCFANLIYAIRINSHGISRDSGVGTVTDNDKNMLLNEIQG